ncbi:MAG: VIT1/CCC1 transporter family protein [Candidatus Magasanikbacteria bacterium]
MSIRHHYNPHFIHHHVSPFTSLIREVVFGMEDGMVSTLGAVTGIAAATQNHSTVILSGFIVVAVESISMGVGSYLSNKSEADVEKRKLHEERIELNEFPEEERQELEDIYKKDGWPVDLAHTMAQEASKSRHLFLHEMACHELAIFPDVDEHPVKKGVAMFFSYVAGGAIPLIPYLVFSIKTGIITSIIITLIGLFALGVGTTRLTKRKWWKAGLEMLILASVAAIIGYAVGQLAENIIGN